MTVPGNIVPLLMSEEAGAGGYEISRSLRFNSIDSAYLSRTPASAGNRKTWTWAGWVKRTVIGETQALFGNYTDGSNFSAIRISNDYIQFVNTGSGGTNPNVTTPNLLRDPSAWYHIVFALDTTQATSSNRVRVYLNGVELITSGTYPDQNADLRVNTASLQQNLGAFDNSGGTGLNGYLADIHFIDGQALAPSSFTEVSATTGQLIPKAYTGTFTGNSFWLKFADNSAATATTLGKDSSGLGNNWTPNNLSVTAGAGNDSLVDTPTSYGTDTGAGGEVRGNYCTWNPLRDNRSGYNEAPRNGNLDTNPRGDFVGTLSLKSGKYYWEIFIQTVTTSGQAYIGAVDYSQVSESGSRGWSTSQIAAMRDVGSFYGNGSTGTAVSYGQGDVLGFALDVDAGKLWIAKNGTWVNSGNPAAGTGHAFSGLTFNSYTPIASDSNTGQIYVLNAGQRAWSYTAPSGFKALCDTNLPTPTIAKGSTAMDVALYTGNGSTQTISGLGFSPDLVWTKARSAANSHALWDAVRGVQQRLISNATDAEVTRAGGLIAFTSDGFTHGSDGTGNDSGITYAAWCWDAGSSTVTNTQGSISSQVRANASAGFSVVTYTGNNTNGATVGHGLNVAPSWIIIKNRSVAYDWIVLYTDPSKKLYLNLTNAPDSYTQTTRTSSIFTLENGTAVNGNGNSMVAYCFAPVSGYSSFGSYTGNGSADGPFVYTGFRPRFLLMKSTSAGTNWFLIDTARDSVNSCDVYLFADASASEGTAADYIDICSNGFKYRYAGGGLNTNGETIIYAAFAESPFQYARAR